MSKSIIEECEKCLTWKKECEKCSFHIIEEYSRYNPHLHQYINEWVKVSPLGPPKFVEKLSREMGFAKRYNYIYPVGGPIFIHVYKDVDFIHGIYHPIEPTLPLEDKPLLYKVEELVASMINEKTLKNLDRIDKKELLEKLLDDVIIIENDGKKLVKDKIALSKEIYMRLKYEFLREKVGLSILEPFIRDPYIEDISCDGIGYIFIEHKVFHSLKSTIQFKTHEELDSFIIKLAERAGKPVSPRRPIVDATLPDGSRLNIVFGKDLSQRGSNFTIRKHKRIPMSITELIKFGTLDARIAAYLWIALESSMSVFVCGETASGKTTTLNAITVFIRPSAKIVSIEDTPEVILPHPNWVSEVTRHSDDETSSIDLYDLLKAALRQRPNYIIVGEIRGREGYVAFQAAQTGHPIMSTFHAANMDRLIQRLTGQPINIPPTYIDNLNIVIFQSLIIDPRTGRVDRRVISVNEIIGYDSSENTCNYIEIFSWDPIKDVHVFRGIGNSYILEYKIAPRRGLSGRDVRKIYDELEIRAKIIESMVRNKVLNYYDVWKIISKIYNIHVKDALRRIDKICGEILKTS